MKQILRFSLLFIFVLSAILQPGTSAAQEKMVVQGVVKDSEKQPLIGVSIVEAGTTNGVNTDLNGNFRIQVKKGAKLRFSYVGYELQVVTAHASQLDVRMVSAATDIDQIVVTGYSQTELRKSTGSVGILESKDLKDTPLANVDQLIKGKLAGVNVQAISGRPGEAAKIRIRGQSTITGDSEPLWVVDGVPMQKDMPKVTGSQVKSGDFTNFFATGVGGINPNDIESITVLKDAAAAAIYGSRASGGVIVVTTKRGAAGRTRLSYSGSVSIQTRPTRSPNLMNSQEKLAWEQELWEEFSAPGYASGQYYPVVGIVGMLRSGRGGFGGMSKAQQDAYIEQLGGHTTDWFGELFRNSISTNHHLSISGGSEKLRHYISMGYGRNNGIVLKNNYDRYNISAKIDATPNKRLSYGVSTDFSHQKSMAPSDNVNMFKYAYFANPYERPYNDDGSYRADQTYFSMSGANGTFNQILPDSGFNLMREINETSSKSTSASFSVRGNLNYNITKDLRFSGLASFSYASDFSENINGKESYAAYSDRPFEHNLSTSKRTYGSIFQNSAYNMNYMLRGQLNYGRTFGKIHRVNVLGGAEIRSSYSQGIYAKRYGYDPISGNHSTPLFPETDAGKIDYNKLIQFGNIIDGSAGQSVIESAFASFYGAADYALLNRYIFNFTVRSDGSNNFGSKEQFNAVWSAGFSWNIDEESFMKGGISKAISSMTFRMSTGYTGGVNQSVYPLFIMDYDQAFRKTEDNFYRIGNIRNAPNPRLRWERTRDVKAGLDIGFLKDRLRMQVEVYHRKGSDLVTQVPVTVTTGFSAQSYNTSAQTNQGVEVSFRATPIQVKGFNWTISANIAYNRNELTKYVDPSGSSYGAYSVGYPLGKIFTGKPTGIDPKTGVYEFEVRPDAKLNSLADYKDRNNYMFYVGTGNAPWSGGFYTTFSYKGLALSMSGSFSLNGKVFNNITSPASYNQISSNMSTTSREKVTSPRYDLFGNHLNVNRDVVNRWTPSNPRTDAYPRLIDSFAGRLTDDNGVYFGDYLPESEEVTRGILIEDVSYLKLGSISLSYSLPDRISKQIHMSNLGISFTMNNLYTFTNYSGIDPETPGAVYPQSRSFTIGLTMGF